MLKKKKKILFHFLLILTSLFIQCRIRINIIFSFSFHSAFIDSMIIYSHYIYIVYNNYCMKKPVNLPFALVRDVFLHTYMNSCHRFAKYSSSSHHWNFVHNRMNKYPWDALNILTVCYKSLVLVDRSIKKYRYLKKMNN